MHTYLSRSPCSKPKHLSCYTRTLYTEYTCRSPSQSTTIPLCIHIESYLETPNVHTRTHTQSIHLDTFEGFRLDLTKPLNNNFAMMHSLYLGNESIPPSVTGAPQTLKARTICVIKYNVEETQF